MKKYTFPNAQQRRSWGFFQFDRLVVERSDLHMAGVRRLLERQLFRSPRRMRRAEILRQRDRRAAEFYAAGFRGGDALRLPLSDKLPLVLRHERQDLQHKIGDKRSHQVLPLPGVQQRHIQNADIRLLFLGQHAPLILHLFIIAPQPVDALDHEQIARLQFFDQLFVLRAIKIFAGYLVNINKTVLHAPLVQGDALPVLVLIPAGHPDIAINIHFVSPFRRKV